MGSLVHYVYDGYTYIFKELANPLTRDWFMAGSPLNLLTVLGIYLSFCLKLGPWFMKHRKPYDLVNTIKIYNIFQIIACLYLFCEGSHYVLFSNYNFYCQGLDDDSPSGLRVARLVWLYYMVKVIDLLDTVFFVLRKSYRQISSLHLHHHTLMPIASWFAITYIPGGQGALVGLINCFVHVIMYTYYFIAGLGEEYKKYLWWKKYLTMLQLVQFLIVGIHSIQSLFYQCSYPPVLKVVTIIYALIFINLFGQFYYKTYVKTKKVKKETKNGIQNGTKKGFSQKSHRL